MSFDPTFPPTNALLVSAEFREQFLGLFNLIQAVPAGPPGPQGNDGNPGAPGNDGAPGAQGPPFAQAIVDGVSTLNPGDSAQVAVSFDGTNVHFSFAIPRGNDGTVGATGAQGPAFANAIVDSVTTLNPGDNATVGVSFDGTNVHFAFAIPRGADGVQGPQGVQGNDGPQGIQGPPGEVTAAQLSTAIAGTSNNTNAVATLDTPFADPDMEAMRGKMNELILAQRR